MKKTFTHLFWDLDHTLWDFEKNAEAAMHELYLLFNLEKINIPLFADFYKKYHAHNEKYWDRFRKGFITRTEMRWKRMNATLLDYKINNEKLAKEMGENFLELLPLQTHLMADAKEVLHYCQEKNYTQHLITNGFEATQWQKIQNSGLASYFTTMISSEKAMCLKPQKEIFDYAIHTTNANIETSLMIGDALEIDIVGARNAGWQQVYFNPNATPHAEKVSYEIKNLAEMYAIV